MRRELGVRPAVDIDQGLERTARWARTLEPRAPRPFREIEIRRGLPPSWEQENDSGS